MIKKPKEISLESILRLVVVLLCFIIPSALLIVSVYVLNKVYLVKKRPPEETKVEIEERLAPSQVLNNKSKYSRKTITIRGKVSPEPVVCERKKCPPEDSCCGCDSERDLIVSDSGVSLTSKTKGRMKLLDEKGGSFCQRRQPSCEYDCRDWIEGAVYDVSGLFYAESPPPGWKLSLDYYFQVENKDLVKKAGFAESLGNLWREIKEIIKNLRSTGYYILP